MPLKTFRRTDIALLLVFSLALAWIVMSTIPPGFLSDDFVHLVEDAGEPWYQSSDHLYRPLRNLIFRGIPGSTGLDRFTIGALMGAAYIAAMWLFGRFAQAYFALDWAGAAAATSFVFFSPRNHALLFWFATMQDLLATLCLLGMLLAWKLYRDGERDGRGSPAAYWLAVGLFGVALGMKETAAVYVGLLALADAWRHWSRNRKWKPDLAWVWPFGAFAVPAALFAAFVLWYPNGLFRIAAQGDSRSVYSASGSFGIVLAEIKSLAHTITPFGGPLVFRDPDPGVVAGIAAACLFFCALAWLSRQWGLWIWAALWAVTALAPTSVFARTVSADYYLFVAQFGFALACAKSVESLAVDERRRNLALLAAAAVFAAMGGWRLWLQGQSWREAARRAGQATAAIQERLGGQATGEVWLLGVPHGWDGKPVLNNGVRGQLRSKGAPPGLRWYVLHESELPGAAIQPLRREMERCAAVTRSEAPKSAGPDRTVIDLAAAAAYRDACRVETVEANRRAQPGIWY